MTGDRLRILLVTANFRPSVGGIERFVEILARGLAERRHNVTIATCRTRGAPAEEWDGAVRVIRIPSTDVLRERLGVPYPIPSPACVRTLRRLVRKADIVHAHDALYLTTVAALVLGRRGRVPSVLTQHVAFVPQKHAFLDLAQQAAVSTIGRTARLANVVAATNPSVAEWARRTWRLQDVRTLPVGVPSSMVPAANRDATRRELGLAPSAFLALFAGRDVPKKRLDLFLAASDPAYELVAVTDRADGESSGARLVPFMSPERFGRLLAAADAFVLPSTAEGFPFALLEALVAGVPCIVAREPGYEQYLADGDVVFAPATAEAIREALLLLASDASYREGLAERARALGERSFGLDQFVAAYETLYGEVIRSQRTLQRTG